MNWIRVETSPGSPYTFQMEINPHFRLHWNKPAVYRWIILKQASADIQRLYIGEAEHLPRRIYGYLHPGPSQRTNQRLKSEFEKEITTGNVIFLEVLNFTPFTIENITISQEDLHNKMVRRFLENLCTMYYSKAGYTVLNA